MPERIGFDSNQIVVPAVFHLSIPGILEDWSNGKKTNPEIQFIFSEDLPAINVFGPSDLYSNTPVFPHSIS
jgi:hypothetical protein